MAKASVPLLTSIRLDLSFPSFDRAAELVSWPGDLATLMVGVAARQGASHTAIAQALLMRSDDAAARAGQASFNRAVAALLAAGGAVADMPVNDPFTFAGQGMFNASRHKDDREFKPGTGAPIEDQ